MYPSDGVACGECAGAFPVCVIVEWDHMPCGSVVECFERDRMPCGSVVELTNARVPLPLGREVFERVPLPFGREVTERVPLPNGREVLSVFVCLCHVAGRSCVDYPVGLSMCRELKELRGASVAGLGGPSLARHIEVGYKRTNDRTLSRCFCV